MRVIFFVIALALLDVGPVAADTITVQLEGVEDAERDNILATLSVARHASIDGLNDAMALRLHGRATAEIESALAPFGYYEVSVRGKLVPVDGGWIARYVIDRGPPVLLRTVDIRIDGDGRTEAAFNAIAAPRPGERLRHQEYERIKRELRATAESFGYLDASFARAELRVEVGQRAADIHLHLETGRQFRFGDLTLEQFELEDAFLRRWVRFRPGDPYNPSDLLALQYALSDSGYFTAVEVAAERPADGGHVIPVSVRMYPAARHRYSAGIGYGTDTGPRATATWENRRVNARGHRLGAEATASRTLRTLTTRYLIPLHDPVNDRLSVAAGWRDEELGDLDSERLEMLLSWSVRDGDWQRTLSTSFLNEREEVAGVRARASLVIPGVEWTYATGSINARPRDTRRLTLAASGSTPALGASTSYLRLSARGRMTLPVGVQDRIILRAELGAIASADATSLPASQRFFAGGDYSVRGYRYQSLGPRDVNGNVIGGRYVATIGVEWEHWLNDDWGVALFVDHGNAFDDSSTRFSTGAGIGVRWQLPFAVFALDFAHPFDDRSGRSIRLHLNLGGEQ